MKTILKVCCILAVLVIVFIRGVSKETDVRQIGERSARNDGEMRNSSSHKADSSEAGLLSQYYDASTYPIDAMDNTATPLGYVG